MSTEPLCDEEIVAELFQIARTGQFVTKEALLEQASLQFPGESRARLESCSRKLGQILMNANYNNYADEWNKPGRHRTSRKSA